MWVPIALSRDVPAGATRAVLLDGRELALWRGESGSIQVWEDRCPHRGMRLSFGFVRGETLNCLYHGWAYGTGASCQAIPAHPGLDVPTSIKATAFPVAEVGGMVWTAASPAALPEPPLGAQPLASVAVDAPPSALAIEGMAEPSHLQAVICTLDGISFYIGWHRAGATKTMLHASTLGSVDPLAAMFALRKLRDQAERRAA